MAPTKSPSFLSALATLAEAHIETPYNELLDAYRAAGWKYRLREAGVEVTPNGSVLVRMDVLLGTDWDRLEVFDTATIRLPDGLGPISVAARVQLLPTVAFLVTGRLPPQAPPAERPAAGTAPNGAWREGQEMTIDAGTGDGDIVLPGAEVEYLREPPGAAVKVLRGREPDGLPLFADLYAIEGVPTGSVVDAVLDEVATFMESAASVEQVDALVLKNPKMFEFVKDLGTPESFGELKAMGLNRKRELGLPPGGATMRRRAAAKAN